MKRKIVLVALVIFICGVLVVGGYQLGYNIGYENAISKAEQSVSDMIGWAGDGLYDGLLEEETGRVAIQTILQLVKKILMRQGTSHAMLKDT